MCVCVGYVVFSIVISKKLHASVGLLFYLEFNENISYCFDHFNKLIVVIVQFPLESCFNYSKFLKSHFTYFVIESKKKYTGDSNVVKCKQNICLEIQFNFFEKTF